MKILKNNKSAFNLIEMSIVLLVIGLIVAGIAGATSLTRSAKVSGARQITNASPIVMATNDLALWLETSLPESFDVIKQDDDNITVWNDTNKTNSNPYVATATANPKFDLDDINGLPGVKLNGTTQYLQIPNFRADGYFTLFVVGNFVSGAKSFLIEHSAQADSVATTDSGFNFYGYGDSNPAVLTRLTNQIVGVTNQDWFGTTAAVGVMRYDGTNLGYKKNGSAFTNVASAAVPDTSATETLNIGSRNGTSLFTEGSFGEIIHYNRALDDDEVDDILEYLNRKWKLY